MSQTLVDMPAVSGHVQLNGDTDMNGVDKSATHAVNVRFATGLILPPPEIKCKIVLITEYILST